MSGHKRLHMYPLMTLLVHVGVGEREHLGAVHDVPAAAVRVVRADAGHDLPADRWRREHRLLQHRPAVRPRRQPRAHRPLPRRLLRRARRRAGKKERENVLFNDALNTFYLRLYGVRHMVKDHSDSDKGNPLPPHRLL